MPINLHLTPTVPSKHPSIVRAFLILAVVSVHPRLYPALLLPLLHGPGSGNPSPSRHGNKNSDTVLKPRL